MYFSHKCCNYATQLPKSWFFLNLIFGGHIKKETKAQNLPLPNHEIAVKRFLDSNLLKNPTFLLSEELSWLSEGNFFFLIEVSVPKCTVQLFWGVLHDKGQKYRTNKSSAISIHQRSAVNLCHGVTPADKLTLHSHSVTYPLPRGIGEKKEKNPFDLR